MPNKDPYAPLVIIAGILAVLGIVLVLISMFGPQSASWTLPAALGCVAAGLILNLIYRIKTPKR